MCYFLLLATGYNAPLGGALVYFWLGPLYKLFKYSVYFDLRWIVRILGPLKISSGPIKI